VELTVSRPVQIFALVALLVAVAGAGMMFVTGKHAPNAAGTVASPTPAASKAATKALAHPATARRAVTPATTRRPAAPAVVHKPKPTVGANGLPMALVRALRAHRIVVVSVVDPQSQTDAVSYAEARAGARDVGVGFLVVSVLDDLVAGPLTAALPDGSLLPEPGLLFYRRPGTLVERIDGFADRAAVAQAAVAALTAPPLGPTAAVPPAAPPPTP
jgi:hypothetical protein